MAKAKGAARAARPTPETPTKAAAPISAAKPAAQPEAVQSAPAAPASLVTPAVQAPATAGTVPALSIRSIPDSFCRAGRRWSRDERLVALSEFTPAQVEALRAESNLVVEDSTLPAPSEGGV